MEELKDIIGFEGYYQISNLGKVIKLDRYEDLPTKLGKVVKRFRKGGEVYLTISKRKNSNYKMACLWKLGKVKCIGLHRLLAIHFIPNPENKKEVNHIDGNGENNNLDNLEWCTRSENELHKYRVLGRKPWNNGLTNMAETHPNLYKKIWDTRRNNLLLNNK